MNTAVYLHLCWKEYRTIRLFWLSVVILTLLLQWSVMILGYSAEFVSSLAVAFPTMFAVGSASVAFSGEREEGTFDFLRASPISAWQVFISKLCVTSLATLAMYCALNLLSKSFFSGLPQGFADVYLTSPWAFKLI